MFLVYDGKESLSYPTNESLATNSAIFRWKYDGIKVRGLYNSLCDEFFIERRYFKMHDDGMAVLEPVTGGIFCSGKCNSFGEFFYGRGKCVTDQINLKMIEVQDKIEFCNNDDGDSDGPESDDAQAARALGELKKLIVTTCKVVLPLSVTTSFVKE